MLVLFSQRHLDHIYWCLNVFNILDLYKNIPADLINFVVVTLFSLLIGLEQRRRHMEDGVKEVFGTDRTFTLAGIFGFILYKLSPGNLLIFGLGAVILSAMVTIFYYHKIKINKQFGMTSLIVLFITYSLAPLIYTQPLWLFLLVVITVLIITEIKKPLKALSSKFDDNEFITLAKFLTISGVVLPLLPDKIISSVIPVSPYKFWLAVVVVSAISYLSYLLQKFVFPKKGVLLSGFLGGLYSSTATTFVLAKKSKSLDANAKEYAASITLATAMMFVRVFILVLIFNKVLAGKLLLPLAVLFALSLIITAIFQKTKKKGLSEVDMLVNQRNPLEFKTALIFAVLFIFFGIATQYVLQYYGKQGLNLFALVVGITDIDPFLLNLFQGKYEISIDSMVRVTLIAITSNNVMKLGYSVFFGDKVLRKYMLAWLLLILVSIGFIVF